jgi:ribA/ribD-fused uncharacterized protein
LPHGATVIFYSKSADADDLALGVPHWRKVLSNFHPVEIEVGGRRYPSVEHAFHAAKARCSNKPEVAAAFEIGGSVPANAAAAKKAGGRAGFAKMGATLDCAEWDRVRDDATMMALRARWLADPLFRHILLATRDLNLTLVHFERGGWRSYWGGTVIADNIVVGANTLGRMLMELRDTQSTGDD